MRPVIRGAAQQNGCSNRQTAAEATVFLFAEQLLPPLLPRH